MRVSQIRAPAGAKVRAFCFAGNAALIFNEGAGVLEVSGRSRAMAVGIVEIVGAGEPCAMSAVTDLHAYVVIAKEPRQ